MAIASNTPVPIPGGWTLAKHLKVGDWVFSCDGLPVQIESIQEYTPQKMYEIKMEDSVCLDVDAHAKFPCLTFHDRNNYSKSRHSKPRKRTQKYFTPEQMLEKGLVYAKQQMFSIETTKPVQYPTEDHAVPPFIAGLWLTRKSKHSRFTLNPNILEYIRKEIRKVGWGSVMFNSKVLEVRPSIPSSFLGRYPSIPKDVPVDYDFGTVDQRIDFLRGILASKVKCYCPKNDVFKIYSRSVPFLIRIQSVAESLGIKTFVYEFTSSLTNALFFRSPFKLHPDQEVTTDNFLNRRTVRDIKEIEPISCIHFKTPRPIVVGQGYLAVWH